MKVFVLTSLTESKDCAPEAKCEGVFFTHEKAHEEMVALLEKLKKSSFINGLEIDEDDPNLEVNIYPNFATIAFWGGDYEGLQLSIEEKEVEE